MKEVKYVLEVAVFNTDKNFQISKDYFKTNDRLKLVEKAQNSECDILCLRFNCENIEDVSVAKKYLIDILPKIKKPLMINGSGNDEIDKKLLPELISVLKKESIISNANENTYKSIIPFIKNHKLVLKTPIDINLCKELNILSVDFGLSKDKIIMDTDIGGLGYGLDYGYSTIEKIKLEDDEYLNLPIISFVTYESLKTKEAKTEMNNWGELSKRANMFELASASALKAAGADIIVMYNPCNIKIMKGLK